MLKTVDVSDLGTTLRAGNQPAQDGQHAEMTNNAVSTAEIYVDSQRRAARAMRV